MKSATLITREGGTVTVYYKDNMDEVVCYDDNLNMHIVDNDVNQANEKAWYVENQQKLCERQVFMDKLKLTMQKQSVEGNVALMTEVAHNEVARQVEQQQYANELARGCVSPIAKPEFRVVK